MAKIDHETHVTFSMRNGFSHTWLRPADFAAYAAALDYFRDNGIVAIAGNESSLQEINRQKPDYLNIINVL